jgi:hypothetical protein
MRALILLACSACAPMGATSHGVTTMGATDLPEYDTRLGDWNVNIFADDTVTVLNAESIRLGPSDEELSIELKEPMAATPFTHYEIRGHLRADTDEPGAEAFVKMEFLDKDLEVLHTSTLQVTFTFGADTWQEISRRVISHDADTRYMRLVFGKTSHTSEFAVWANGMHVLELPDAFLAWNHTTQSIGSGIVVLEFPNEVLDPFYHDEDQKGWGWRYDGTTSRFTARRPGLYAMSAQCRITYPASISAEIGLRVNGTANYRGDTITVSPSSGTATFRVVSDVILRAGDYVDVYFTHSHGSAVSTVSSGIPDSRFGGRLVSP